MKVYLEFDMPMETDDYDDAIKGWRYRAIIDEFYEALRRASKYEDVKSMTIDEIRELLNSIRLARLSDD
jgi:hypothetical protein